MKKTLAALTIVAVLGFGALAFAHGGGYGGGMMGGGNGYGMMGGGMMGGGNGYGMMGGGMMGGGYGNHMQGRGNGYGDTKETREFMEKTADLRREMSKLRFEFDEAYRAGDEKTAKKLYKSIEELAEKIHDKAPKGNFFSRGFSRHMW